jgi:hypothetical protein
VRGFDCLVAGIASVIVVAAVATQQADASPKPPTCDSYPDTVVANGQVKVFRIGWRRATVRRPEGFYACDVRSRRLRFLGSDAVDARDVRLIRLAGRYVAFEYYSCHTI